MKSQQHKVILWNAGVRIMGAKAVEALHDCVVSKRDHGMTGMITDFSQGGINFYRYDMH